jgi:hypothetical protein
LRTSMGFTGADIFRAAMACTSRSHGFCRG